MFRGEMRTKLSLDKFWRNDGLDDRVILFFARVWRNTSL